LFVRLLLPLYLSCNYNNCHRLCEKRFNLRSILRLGRRFDPPESRLQIGKGVPPRAKWSYQGAQVATTPPAQMPLKQRWWAIPLRRRALGPCLCVALPLGNGLILDPDRSFLSPTDCFAPGPSSQPVFSGGRCVAHGRSPGAHVLLSPNQSSPRRTNTWNSVESSPKKKKKEFSRVFSTGGYIIQECSLGASCSSRSNT
jgi:hypothetical protein